MYLNSISIRTFISIFLCTPLFSSVQILDKGQYRITTDYTPALYPPGGLTPMSGTNTIYLQGLPGEPKEAPGYLAYLGMGGYVQGPFGKNIVVITPDGKGGFFFPKSEQDANRFQQAVTGTNTQQQQMNKEINATRPDLVATRMESKIDSYRDSIKIKPLIAVDSSSSSTDSTTHTTNSNSSTSDVREVKDIDEDHQKEEDKNASVYFKKNFSYLRAHQFYQPHAHQKTSSHYFFSDRRSKHNIHDLASWFQDNGETEYQSLGYGVWMNGAYSKSCRSMADGSPAYSSTTSSVTTGVERYFWDNALSFGISLGLSHTDSPDPVSPRNFSKTNSQDYSIYNSYNIGNFNVSTTADYSSSLTRTHTYQDLGDGLILNQRAKSPSHTIGGGQTYSYRIVLTEALSTTPEVGFYASRTTNSRYREYGSFDYDKEYNRTASQSLTHSLGNRVKYKFDLTPATFSLGLSFNYTKEKNSTPQYYRQHFINYPTSDPIEGFYQGGPTVTKAWGLSASVSPKKTKYDWDFSGSVRRSTVGRTKTYSFSLNVSVGF